MKFAIDAADPSLARLRKESELPKYMLFAMDKLEPHRLKDRTDIEDPIATCEINEIFRQEPIADRPKTEIPADPMRH
jgi:hypothetical protein